jgi:hypothetical protein
MVNRTHNGRDYNPGVPITFHSLRLSSAHVVFLLAVGLPFVVSMAYLNAGARTPSGALMLPLDDAYIHLQYAWQAAHGHFLQYNTGETPTTGATSLLYVLMLALGFLTGIGKDAMPSAILVLGAALFVASTVTLADLARHLARLVGVDANLSSLAAIALFAGSGWMAWSFLSGMETGLLFTLGVVGLWAHVTRRIKLMALASAMAALTRPEAALLPAAILMAEAAFQTKGEALRMRPAAWMALSLSLAAVPPAVNYFYTGSVSASGMLAKSLFTMVPFEWSAVWSGFGASLFEIWARLFGGLSSDGHWHTFPLLPLLAMAGAVILARSLIGRRLAVICAAWFVLGTASTATLQTATWHHYRYQVPYYSGLLVLGGIGAISLAHRWFRGRRGAWLMVLVPLALWTIYSVRDFSLEYVRDTQTAARMQLALAQWLHDHTPLNARVAVHDIGIVRYFSDRATIDVVGLTTVDMTQAYRNGPGSIYEAMERFQPDYYAVYPNLAPPYFGISSAPDLLGPELFRVDLNDYSHYTSAGATQVVTKPDWSKTGLADAPQQPSTRTMVSGLTLADVVDIADLDSEKLHGYTWWNVGEPAGFPTDARVQTYRQDPNISLADGGRMLTGGESFTLNVKPAVPLTLVARLHQTVDMVLSVDVNGANVGDWRLPAVPGQWLESTLIVGPEYLPGTSAHFVLTVKDVPTDSRYSPFHYWAYQGPSVTQPTPAPQHVIEAAFGNVAGLVGFNSSATVLTPGQELDLTLFWRALTPEHANDKVFVHVTNPSNDTADGIIAQVDEAPRAGTFPFWVWPAGETVSESLRLEIPQRASPGKYLLLVGIYNSDTGARLAISGAPDYGSGRLLLGEVVIR